MVVTDTVLLRVLRKKVPVPLQINVSQYFDSVLVPHHDTTERRDRQAEFEKRAASHPRARDHIATSARTFSSDPFKRNARSILPT